MSRSWSKLTPAEVLRRLRELEEGIPDTKQSIIEELDWAAARCDEIPQMRFQGATARQCAYLGSLLWDQGLTPTDIGFGGADTQALLTKKEASKAISSMFPPSMTTTTATKATA